MADTNIIITDTVSPSSDESLLDVVNEISMRINGIEAQEIGNRPVKAEIIAEVNSVQKKICNKYDWNFLRKVVSVNGYNVSTNAMTQTSLTAGLTIDNSNELLNPTASPSVTDYIAIQFTPSELARLDTFTINLWIANGLGLIAGTATGYISETLNIDDVLATSDEIDMNLFNNSPNNSIFNFNGGIMIEPTKSYYFIAKLVYSADNGASLNVGFSLSAGMTTVYTDILATGTWTAYTSKNIYYAINGLSASYTDTITLPLAVQNVYRVYSDGANLTKYQDDKYINEPESTPLNKFVVRTFDDTGEMVILINPSTANTLIWNVEYKMKTPVLAGDTDLPVIPSNYRTYIVDNCVFNFMGRGFGQQEPDSLKTIQIDILDSLKSMKREYLNNSPIAFRVQVANRTSFDEPDKTNEPNRAFVKRGQNILRNLYG